MKFKSNTLICSLQPFIRRLSDDGITVYAAQASFFVVISAVPFLSLLISIASFFIPTDIREIIQPYTLSSEFMTIIGSLLDDLRTAPKVSLLSFSAIGTLWSSSKGIAAIQTGLRTVYHTKTTDTFLIHRLKSLAYTLLFVALILSSVVLILFGDFLLELVNIPILTRIISSWRTPFVATFMCILFTAMYFSAAKRGSKLRTNLFAQIPGAAFASLGWILFSFFYSYYIEHFPNAFYLYGGLAAVCLIMLWLYFCMIILLLGAEVNQFFQK